jgi:hypothetical protein
MFIVSINNYNVPFNIDYIHYINRHIKYKKCHYCDCVDCRVEHYILNLSIDRYGSEVVNTMLRIDYLNSQIIYNFEYADILVNDIISKVNYNIFNHLRNKMLLGIKFKCILIKPIFIYFNLIDCYYELLKIIINMNDIDFLIPNTKIYINTV